MAHFLQRLSCFPFFSKGREAALNSSSSQKFDKGKKTKHYEGAHENTEVTRSKKKKANRIKHRKAEKHINTRVNGG